MSQLALFPEDRIRAKWEEFHAANPHVYERLREGALALRRRGWKRYGIAALWEGLRYEAALQTTTDDWKLDNSLRSIFARELMKNEPELAGFFETRRRRA